MAAHARDLPAARRGHRRRGRTGAAEDDVEAGLTSVGPLSLGSLMLGVSRGEGTRPQLEFGGEPTAIASFDIYGGDAGLPLSARSKWRATSTARRWSRCRSR